MHFIFASGQPMPVSSATSLTAWLPAVLQEPETYFTMIACFAVYGLAKGWPASDKYSWIPELAAMIVGIGVACGLQVGHSYVYSIGVGFIAAWAASSFYTMGKEWLTSRIRSILGISAPVSSTPDVLSPGPGDRINPSNKNP